MQKPYRIYVNNWDIRAKVFACSKKQAIEVYLRSVNCNLEQFIDAQFAARAAICWTWGKCAPLRFAAPRCAPEAVRIFEMLDGGKRFGEPCWQSDRAHPPSSLTCPLGSFPPAQNPKMRTAFSMDRRLGGIRPVGDCLRVRGQLRDLIDRRHGGCDRSLGCLCGRLGCRSRCLLAHARFCCAGSRVLCHLVVTLLP